jgi:Arc/MetJ-type ribon-helix-helix transcriptional regulator
MSDFAQQETDVLRPDASESARCPHFEVVDEETLRRLFSKVAAVRSENYELFQFTHRPMEVFRGASTDGEVWHEDRIYQEFSEDRIRNFAVVIEGEVGTGKSELCAYLSHRLRRDGRPMLHIDKDDDLMSILSERIPDFYEEHFDEELPGASDFQNLRSDIVEIPQAVANNATSGAVLSLRHRGYDVAPGGEQEDDIRDYIAEKLQRLVQRGEYAQKIQFVGENEYKQRDELQVFGNDVPVHEAVEAWNETLWREIRSRYDTASLGDVLEEVGQKFEDTRPVIVFEDFSIAAMEAEKLRNYMERDKSADNWDFIVAGTRDSTAVLHTQTAEDRFEFFQTNEQESNSVLFLDENSAVDFVRPYLGYIKAHDDSVRYDRNTDDGRFDLKPAPEGSICAQCGFCDESFRDLFPFNRPFLRRIYAGLDESQQSPREFIMEVFEVLQTFHDGFVDAPSFAETLRTLENTVSVADAVYEDAEAYADLAKWYGVPKNGEVVVDRTFVDAFGFPTEGLPDEIEIGGEEVHIASTGRDGPRDRCPECGADAWATDADGNRVCSNCGYGTGGGGGKSPLEREIDEQKARVDSWVEDPDKYPETDQYVRIALRDLIEELTDGFRLIEGTPLHYNLSSQKSPYVYPDTNEAPDEDQIVLDRDDFRRSDLRRLVEYGVRLDKDARTADTDAQVEASGTQLTGYAEEWRNRIFTTQLENDDVFYKGHVDYDFADFVLATYATLTLLDDPWSEITAEQLNERFQSDEEFTLDQELLDGFQDTLSHGQVQAVESAMDDAEYVERVLRSLLGVSASTLDVPMVRERLDRCPPYRVLSMLGRGYIDNIEFRIRFDSGHNVRDFADTMYDVRGALDELNDHGYRRDTVMYVTDSLAGTDLERVSDRYQKLKTYDNVDPDLAERLGQVCQYTQEGLDDVVEAARLATELDSRGPLEQITATLASIKLDNEPLVSEFKAVPLAGTSGPDQLGKEFTEVSRYYVD